VNLRIELIKAENGYVVQLSQGEVFNLYVAPSDDTVKKIVSTSVMAFLTEPGDEESGQTVGTDLSKSDQGSDPEIQPTTRAERRRK
jgi:hypothetical protein